MVDCSMSGAKVIDLTTSCSGRSPRSRFRRVCRISVPTSSKTHCGRPCKARAVSFACSCRVLTPVEMVLLGTGQRGAESLCDANDENLCQVKSPAAGGLIHRPDRARFNLQVCAEGEQTAVA